MTKIMDQLRGIKGVEAELEKLRTEWKDLVKKRGMMLTMPKYHHEFSHAKIDTWTRRIDELDGEISEVYARLEELKRDPKIEAEQQKRLGALRGLADDLQKQLKDTNLEYRNSREQFAFDVLEGADPIKKAADLQSIKERVEQLTRAAELVQAAIKAGTVKK